ncbi:unknown [Salmonella phage FelixO1]|uniref:Uncharacterized protein n=1 Tax=Salmonella phage Felix O1 (isolate Felix O1-VT1) TaxID=1283336 RepID=Q6KGD6_BPFO1|nr:unknown [Salmonella phage FelixO1]
MLTIQTVTFLNSTGMISVTIQNLGLSVVKLLITHPLLGLVIPVEWFLYRLSV